MLAKRFLLISARLVSRFLYVGAFCAGLVAAMAKRHFYAVISVLLATALLPVVAGAQAPIYLLQWGSHGSGNGQFYYPASVAVDASGSVYVADQVNHRIQKFTGSGVYITQWGSYGYGDGQFRSPSGVAVDAQGDIYVSDYENYRVEKFTSDGAFLTKFGTLPGQGLPGGDAGLGYVNDVAVDALGDVYVVDQANCRIVVFSSTGTFLRKWGQYGTRPGELQLPSGVAIDASGVVYVADTWNQRIQTFSSSGQYLMQWGSQGSGNGQFYNPNRVSLDASGNVYVADTDNHRIQKFTSTGAYLAQWGTRGSGDGQFDHPASVAVSSNHYIYVADLSNDRVQLFVDSPVPTKSTSWGRVKALYR